MLSPKATCFGDWAPAAAAGLAAGFAFAAAAFPVSWLAVAAAAFFVEGAFAVSVPADGFAAVDSPAEDVAGAVIAVSCVAVSLALDMAVVSLPPPRSPPPQAASRRSRPIREVAAIVPPEVESLRLCCAFLNRSDMAIFR